MLLYLAFLLAGVVFGVFTGLVPGLHPNTVVFMSLPVYIGLGVDYLIYGSFIVGLSVSHTFHDFLPAIFLGAPEAESALSSLPGADMAARGEGLTAFHATVYGGMFAILVFLLFSPLLVAFLEPIYTFFERFMFRVLLFFLAFIVFNTPNLRSSVFLAGLAGVLGIFSFRMPVNQQFVLMPVFSGLFAVPALFRVFQQEADLPDQKSPGADIETSARGGVIGFFSGLVSGVLPGVGPAVSTTFLSPLMSDRRQEFLAGMGAVNTSDVVVSFVALLLIGKSRSGASVALQSISRVTPHNTAFLAGAALLAVAVSVPLALRVAESFASVLSSLELEKMAAAMVAVIASSTFFLTGFPGLLVLATASLTGYAAALADSRQVCMAVLIVPAMVHSGAGIFI